MDKLHDLKDTLKVGIALHPCRCRMLTFKSGAFTTSAAVLWSAFMVRRCWLRLEGGRSFEIIVTGYVPGADEDRFVLF